MALKIYFREPSGSWSFGGELSADRVDRLTPADSARVTALLERWPELIIRGDDNRVVKRYGESFGGVE